MKVDKLTKVLLGLIAMNLTILTVDNLELIPRANATSNNGLKTNYGLIPINEDGSINVHLLDVVDVEIVGIDTYDELEVEVENWNAGQLDVSVGSWNAAEEIEVEVESWSAGQIDVCEICN